MKKYILKDGVPVEEPDLMKWGKQFEKQDRVIAKTIIKGIKVSTVFLGIDHGFNDEEPPILFETMIFGGEHDQYQERYATIEDAKAGHKKAEELVKS